MLEDVVIPLPFEKEKEFAWAPRFFLFGQLSDQRAQ